MSNATFTFRVDDALKTEFSQLAKFQDRSAAQLLRDFMRNYVAQQEQSLEYDTWLMKKIEQSRSSAKAGKLTSNTDVEAAFAAKRAATITLAK
ncbi:CopG family ribbon-helix-helix protein [Marinospirillum insulare]|uniref:Transcriptional regulator n=1 Tax=Marinospirillum insulare TaxID=217169 RepID=A0ABQ5ZVH4_9GAMM|nr:hypothetical protein [Marinospirillum insulare]GLR63030.1 hypothetical protein GCM10007878_04650 [Marinospirillum insulare]